jgi:hypothetical protein
MMVLTCLMGGMMADPEDEVPPSEADAELLRALGTALGPDDLPEGLVDRATQLLAVVDLNAELVALLQEAATEVEMAGTRGDADVAAPMSFVAIDGSITIEIAIEHDEVRGQLIGADAAVVTLERTSGAPVDAPVEALGRFRFTGLAPGPARVRVRVAGATVSTDWFVL